MRPSESSEAIENRLHLKINILGLHLLYFHHYSHLKRSFYEADPHLEYHVA